MIKKWIHKITGHGNDQDKSSEVAIDLPARSPDQSNSSQEKDKTATTSHFGLFKRLKEQMGKTRGGFVRQIDQILLGHREIDSELLDDLEETLIMADMGVTTVQDIFEQLRREIKKKEFQDPAVLRERLKKRITDLLKVSSSPITWTPTPFVVLVIGVNGVGKTTTIAKLAYRLKQKGKNVLLVAADTFRAAAVQQLETWGKRIDVPVIKGSTGYDPSAVTYDGMEAALKQNADVVIVDTAGRLHTKVNLMEELKKIYRIISQKIPGGPHELLIVLDATTGQNAISQAKTFSKVAKVTGIVLTKLDGTAKGGIVVSIAHQMNIPIRFIGIGEKVEDFQEFDPEEFAKAIFEK